MKNLILLSSLALVLFSSSSFALLSPAVTAVASGGHPSLDNVTETSPLRYKTNSTHSGPWIGVEILVQHNANVFV